MSRPGDPAPLPELPLRSRGPDEYQPDIEKLIADGEARGLTFLPILFRMASQDDLTEIASFGLPNRFNHWYFGGIYKQLKIQHEQKLFKILELVLNTDPVYAFLLDENSRLENLTVIAHVLGHVDFFVNNCWFSRSDKDMLNRCEYHARTIRELREKHGREPVDGLITAALTLATGLSAFEKDPALRLKRPFYFLHERIQERARAAVDAETREQMELASRVMEMMRREQEYFDLVARTQIMNEGWASFVEFKLLEDHLPSEQWLSFSLGFSKRPPPYVIGFTLWQDIFRRKGWPGLLSVRAYYEDVAFVDEFLTQDLSERLDLFVLDRESGEKDMDVQKVKARIIEEKLHKNAPVVEVESFDETTGHLVLALAEEERLLDRKRSELFLHEMQRLWPYETTLRDAENEYRWNEAGFVREKR